MKRMLLRLIKLYQKTFSPDHGWFKERHPYGYCRYYPSCSEYSHRSVERFGVIKGIWLSIKRVGRCTPWNEGGYDPIPKK